MSECVNIVELNRELLPFINQANQPFSVIGRISPALTDGKWTYTEEIFSAAIEKTYPDDDADYSEYIQNADKVVFLAFSGLSCIGQIVIRADWNRYAFIEDICVAAEFRGCGAGTRMIKRAEQWAKARNLKGLALETQDNNLLACRFYAKCGFSIGGVNTMLYSNFEKPWSDETAIFWYKKF